MYKLTIIIPVYNEQNTILSVLDLLSFEEKLEKLPVQIIVVDDGSSDNTTELLRNGRHKDSKHIKFIFHKKNQGKGAAIRSAKPYIDGEYVVIQDADLENSVSDIPRLLETIQSECLPVIYGSRRLEPRNNAGPGNPWYFWGGQFITVVTNMLFKQDLTDAPTCYKMFRSDLFKAIPLKQSGFDFCQEVTAKIAKQGIKIKEIPITYYPRTKAQGKKLSWQHGIRALLTLLKMRLP